MSDGLRLLSAAIAAGSPAAITGTAAEFFVDNETAVIDFVRGHYRRYRELPQPATVLQETGVRLPAASESLAYYLDRVHERRDYNVIRDRFAGLRDGLTGRNMTQVHASIAELGRASRASVRRGREIVDLQQAGDLVIQRLRTTRGMGGVTGIEVGWPGYDLTTGGYQNADLISIVGRPGLGKTYVMLRQAERAHAAGHSVLFVTTEMGAEQIGRRHASIALGINPSYLRLNMISTHTQRRLERFYREVAGVDRFRVFSVGMNSTVAAIEAFCQEYMPDVVFIDGAYLLKAMNAPKNASRTDRITAVFDDLKALSLELDRPIIVSTQFSRAAGKGGAEGSLENIGYSDAIGTHSSIVVAIKYGPTQVPKKSRWLVFLKGREGEEGQIAINFKFAPLDMDEFTPEEQETADGENATAGPTPNVDWMM